MWVGALDIKFNSHITLKNRFVLLHFFFCYIYIYKVVAFTVEMFGHA
jgi:hypothetical protein